MKKIIMLISICAVLLSFCSCGKTEEYHDDSSSNVSSKSEVLDVVDELIGSDSETEEYENTDDGVSSNYVSSSKTNTYDTSSVSTANSSSESGKSENESTVSNDKTSSDEQSSGVSSSNSSQTSTSVNPFDKDGDGFIDGYY